MKDIKTSIIAILIILLPVIAPIYGYLISKSNENIATRAAIYSNLRSARSIIYYGSQYSFEYTSIERYYFNNIETFDNKYLNQNNGMAIKIFETNEGKCLIGGMIVLFVGIEKSWRSKQELRVCILNGRLQNRQ